jgi:hypothetical protein
MPWRKKSRPNDRHRGCLSVGHTVPQTYQKLVHPPHFCYIFSHLVIVVIIPLLYLFGHQLGISPDKESSYAEVFG